LFDDCFDSARREIPLRPTIDEFFFAPPPQWQCWFSPRPLGGPLSTETAQVSCGPSAHDHGRTVRRRQSRAQGRRSIPKLAETRTLTAPLPAGWRGSGRLGGQRTHGEGRTGYNTDPRTAQWWPRPPGMVGMLGSSCLRPPYHPKLLRHPRARRGWPARGLTPSAHGWSALWRRRGTVPAPFQRVVWGERLILLVCSLRPPYHLQLPRGPLGGGDGPRVAWTLRPMCGARLSAAAALFQLHSSLLCGVQG